MKQIYYVILITLTNLFHIIDYYTKKYKKIEKIIDNISYNNYTNICGEDDREVTPVPIPNTEVKLFRADDSWGMPPVKIGFAIFIFLFSSVGRAPGC